MGKESPEARMAATAPLAAQYGLGNPIRVFEKPAVLATSGEFHVFEHGAIWLNNKKAVRQPGSGATFLLPWQRIAEYYQSTTHVRSTVSHDEYRFRFRAFDWQSPEALDIAGLYKEQDGWNELNGLIERPIASAQLPWIFNALQQGQPVDFGLLTVTPYGLVKPRKNKQVAWGDMEGMWVRNGWMALRAQGKVWGKWELGGLANRLAFFTLLERFNVPIN